MRPSLERLNGHPAPAGPQSAGTLSVAATALQQHAAEAETIMGTCPDCSSQLEFAEGCKKCHACGYSECG
jgi:hypothetical protein